MPELTSLLRAYLDGRYTVNCPQASLGGALFAARGSVLQGVHDVKTTYDRRIRRREYLEDTFTFIPPAYMSEELLLELAGDIYSHQGYVRTDDPRHFIKHKLSTRGDLVLNVTEMTAGRGSPRHFLITEQQFLWDILPERPRTDIAVIFSPN